MDIVGFLRDPESWRDMRGNAKQLAQSASNAIAGNLTGPVDLINLGLGAIGLPVSERPVGGSEWARRAGLTPDVPQGAPRVAGETLGLLGPVVAAKYAPQIAEGLLAAGDAMPGMSKGRLGPTRQEGAINIDALQKLFPEVDFQLSQTGNRVTLNKVVVPKSKRNDGVGSDFMAALTKAADADGATLALTPSSDFGGNKTRLADFYSRFGFVPNKGKNKDFVFRETMIRQPAPAFESARTAATIAPQDAALETARKNAVEMLGLPENNTAMDRAKALGFQDGWAHGSPRNDIARLSPSRTGAQGPGVYATNYLPEASTYAQSKDGATVYPLMVKKREALFTQHNNPYDELGAQADDELLSGLFGKGKSAVITTQEKTPEWLIKAGAPDMPERQHYVSVKPENFRSRFAAFDPARINEDDLLGRADPALLAALAGGGLLGGGVYYLSDR